MLFWNFGYISLIFKILSLKSFGNSWSNSNARFLILDTKFHFTYSEWNMYQNFVKFQVNVQMIMEATISLRWIVNHEENKLQGNAY